MISLIRHFPCVVFSQSLNLMNLWSPGRCFKKREKEINANSEYIQIFNMEKHLLSVGCHPVA